MDLQLSRDGRRDDKWESAVDAEREQRDQLRELAAGMEEGKDEPK